MGLPKALNVKKIKGIFWNIFIMIKEPLRPILTRLTYPLFQLDWCVILDSHLLNNITIKHNSVGIQYLVNRLRWSQKEGFFACPRSMLRFRFFFYLFINLLATNSNVCESDNFSIMYLCFTSIDTVTICFLLAFPITIKIALITRCGYFVILWNRADLISHSTKFTFISVIRGNIRYLTVSQNLMLHAISYHVQLAMKLLNGSVLRVHRSREWLSLV